MWTSNRQGSEMKAEQETFWLYYSFQITAINESISPIPLLAFPTCVTNSINIILKLFMAFAGTTAYTMPFYTGKMIHATLEIK